MQTFDQSEAREGNVLNFVMNECPPISQNTGTLLSAHSHLRECLSAPRLIKSQTDSARALRGETGPSVTSGPCLPLTLHKTLRVHRDCSRE